MSASATEATDQADGQGSRPRRSAEEVLAAITGRQAAFTWRDLNRQLAKEIADPALAALATDELLRHGDVIGLRETGDAPVSHYTAPRSQCDTDASTMGLALAKDQLHRGRSCLAVHVDPSNAMPVSE